MVSGVYFHSVKTGKATLMKDNNQLSSKIEKSDYRTDILYQIDEYPKIDSEIHFSLYERILLAQLGFVLTIVFDIITTLGIIVFVPTWEALFLSFITGLPFFIFHQLTNLILFSTIPSILVVINKARPI